MILSAIVAVSKNGVIGKENSLPWRIPEDLRRFKRTTLGHPVIMGRKTFESLGRPLPDRTNIVITRNPNLSFPGVLIYPSLKTALEWCEKNTKADDEEVFIIGGQEIYTQSLHLIQKLYLTRVDLEVEGDRFFPSVDLEKNFRIISSETYFQETPQTLSCTFIEAERI